MKRIVFYMTVLLIPLSLLVVTWQGERYAVLKNEISKISERQEKVVEENRRLIAEIAVLSSSARIENIARMNLGLEKKAPEEVIEVTVKKNNNVDVKTGG